MSGLKQRELGTTGTMVTELGLGAMDTPHSPERHETIAAAIDLGVSFIDTARDYAGSEFLLGEAIRERGAKEFQVSTKTFARTADGAQWDVDHSLRTMSVEQIDLYQLHDVSTLEAWDEVMQENGALAGLQVAQYRGLIKHIGMSSHSMGVLERAIESGAFDAVMLEYSAFFTETAALIDRAKELGVGIIVMRPLGGSGRTSTMRGQIAEGYRGPLTPANLLRYVLSNPGISVAIPGARYPSRIHDNVKTATSYEPMSDDEKRDLERAAAELY